MDHYQEQREKEALKEAKTLKLLIRCGAGFMFLFILVAAFFSFSVRIPPAEVGILVDMYGSDKGVNQISVLSTGRNFYNSITHDVIKYPSYIQQQSYSNISFQDKDGLSMKADVAISYKFVPENIPNLYIEYRKDADYIIEVYFPTWIKNAMIKESAKMRVDKLYGEDKEKFRSNVRTSLQEDFQKKGIFIEDVYFTNGIGIPAAVKGRIDEKIKATQIAQQKENELAAVQADAKKVIAQEKGKAESRIIEAQSRAESNNILNKSITDNLLKFRKLEMQKLSIEKWNGVTPTVTSGNGLILDLGSLK